MNYDEINQKYFIVEYDPHINNSAEYPIIKSIEILSEAEYSPVIRKTYDNYVFLGIVAAGCFILGQIAQGFFQKLGATIYDQLCIYLKKFSESRINKHELYFSFNVKNDDELLEVYLSLINPSQDDIEWLFKYGFSLLDEKTRNLKLSGKNIGKIVFSITQKNLVFAYALTRDCDVLENINS